MDLKELVIRNRSYRRFYQEESITKVQLVNWIDLARLSASGMNLQPLKYKLVNSVEKCQTVFDHLSWAGYLKDWPGPGEGERPSAYIIMLGDTTIRPVFGVDPGIAAQSILLGAVESGFGGCIIGSVQKEKLAKALSIPKKFQILYVLALGKPKEIIKLEATKDGSIQYYRDSDMVHHVPKRDLKEIILR
jgi:nitroreductase